MALSLCLAGCKTLNSGDVTGSIPDGAGRDAALQRDANALSKRYIENPQDKNTAISYAAVLRQRSQFAQAVAVLQGIAIKNPQDKEILGAYGKALADAGRLQEAADVLPRAHSPDNPNWTILSAQGAVADRLGDHATARSYYNAALKIVPGEPSVLSNLGLSYTLTKELPKAEQALRQAAESPRADSRVRQNLSMVLSLEGKYAEAEQLGARDTTPEQAAANVNAVKRMAAQSDSWRDLRGLDKTKTASVKTPNGSGNSVAARAPDDNAAPAARASGAAALAN